MSETRKYRTFTAQQKTEIVLASLRGPKSVAEIDALIQERSTSRGPHRRCRSGSAADQGVCLGPGPWSLIATTPVTTSRSSRASNVFFGVDGIDRIERNGKHCAGANQVEGLVRDNRVEVRVLFGACTKAPLCRGFRRSRVECSTSGATSRDNAL